MKRHRHRRPMSVYNQRWPGKELREVAREILSKLQVKKQGGAGFNDDVRELSEELEQVLGIIEKNGRNV